MKKDIIKRKLERADVIIGRDRYFNSAVLVSIAEINGEDCFVFQKRAQGIRQAGEISFPGGKYDELDNCSFLETALRETEEEYGIGREKIEILGYLGALVASSNFIVEVYVGVLNIKNIDELNINKKEVESLLIVPIEYFKLENCKKYSFDILISSHRGKEELIPIKKLGISDEYYGMKNVGNKEVAVYEYKGEVIWGITADIVNELLKYLEKY